MNRKPVSEPMLHTFVAMKFSLSDEMRRLQRTKGGFEYTDLASHLQTAFNLSSQQAKEQTWRFIRQMNDSISFDDPLLHLIEPASPTIEQTIAQWKEMAAGLKSKRSISDKPPSLSRRGLMPADSAFEQFRPKRDRLAKGAPDAVIACYSNMFDGCCRYTVLFGGKMWSVEMARHNWQAGLDPRVVLCVTLSVHPTAPNGYVDWGHILPSSQIGRKVAWADLPAHVRMHIADRILR